MVRNTQCAQSMCAAETYVPEPLCNLTSVALITKQHVSFESGHVNLTETGNTFLRLSLGVNGGLAQAPLSVHLKVEALVMHCSVAFLHRGAAAGSFLPFSYLIRYGFLAHC